MSVTRISQFIAAEGQEQTLSDFLDSIVPEISRAPGCLSCDVLRSRDVPGKMIVLERWESVEAHQEALSDADPEERQNALALLAEPPIGEYFSG